MKGPHPNKMPKWKSRITVAENKEQVSAHRNVVYRVSREHRGLFITLNGREGGGGGVKKTLVATLSGE